MTNDIEKQKPVIRTRVPKHLRLSTTSRLFGTRFPLIIEPVIYGITGRMAEAYSGGYWHFYSLDNGGFYMAPDIDQPFEVRCDNYFTGKLSADALGITACLYTYSHISFSQDEALGRRMANHYHLLRSHIMEHAELGAILSAID